MRVLFLLLISSLHLCAQSWDALASFSRANRVRVLEIAGPEHKGTFASSTSGAVTIHTNKGEVTVESTVVRRV